MLLNEGHFVLIIQILPPNLFRIKYAACSGKQEIPEIPEMTLIECSRTTVQNKNK